MTNHRTPQVGEDALLINRRTFMRVTITAAASLVLPTVFTTNGSLAGDNDNHSLPRLEYHNQNATRNRACTKGLEQDLVFVAQAVYGPDVVIEIYSGGQAAKGTRGKRTGSVRHDDHGHGGRAADIRIRRPDGTLIVGPELARMGQYWLAARLGGVGFEMNQNGAGGRRAAPR